MKIEFSRQIFEKYSNIISWTSVQWGPNCNIWTDGRTERQMGRS